MRVTRTMTETDTFVSSQNVRIYWITIHSHATLLAVICQVLLLWFNIWTLATTGLLCCFVSASYFCLFHPVGVGRVGVSLQLLGLSLGSGRPSKLVLTTHPSPRHQETRKNEKQGEVYLKQPRGVLMTSPLSLSLGICSEVYVHGLRSVHEQAILLMAASQPSLTRLRRCLCSTLFCKMI